MPSRKVFLGFLNNKTTTKDVEEFFKGFGRIIDIYLKQSYGFVEFDDPKDADEAVLEMNHEFLCGSRVTVEHARGVRKHKDDYEPGSGDAQSSSRDKRWHDYKYDYERGGGDSDRYSAFNNSRRRPSSSNFRSDRSYGGRPLSGRPYNTEWRVIVENLSPRCGWQDLKEHLRLAGEVTYAEAHQVVKGEGMADFATEDDLRVAIGKLDGSELYGRRIRLVADVELESRDDSSVSTLSSRSSRSSSRSSSSSRSRSRSRSPIRRRRRSRY